VIRDVDVLDVEIGAELVQDRGLNLNPPFASLVMHQR